MSTFTGSNLGFTVVRDATPASTYAAMTWKVHAPADIRFESYTADIRAAGNYTLKIDGVTRAVVNGVAAAAAGVVFTPAAPVVLAAGSHTFELTNHLGAVQWYSRTALTSLPTGGGGNIIGWDIWQEQAASFPAGSLSFKLADLTLNGGQLHTTISGGTFTAQTWTTTFDEAILLSGFLKKLSPSDAGYIFSVNGVDVATVVKASGTALVNHAFVPAAPLSLAAGTHTFKIRASVSRQYAYKAGSIPVLFGDAHITGWTVWQESTGNNVPGIFFYTLAPPGVPTSVSAIVSDDEAVLSWSPPASGGDVDHYEVRIDGGIASTSTSPHLFTGLTPGGVSYDLEVRAVGPGGASDWVLVGVDTLAPPPPGYYRVELDLGSHSWDVTKDEGPSYGPVLPLSLGWELNDLIEFFPAQSDLQTLTFAVRVPDAADLADVVKGTTVSMRMYVYADIDAEPWQTFTGVVTQQDGEPVPSLDPDAPEGAMDFRVTVFAADDNARLADMYVGYTDDWPIEQIQDRVERICDEAGIAFQQGGIHGNGMVGWLKARPAGAAISALAALKEALKDAADDYTSEPPFEFYGRYVYKYSHAGTDDLDPATLYVYPFRRRVYDGTTVTLDGGLVHARNGKFTKQPGPVSAEWVIVDGTTFGTPGAGIPYVRNTSLLDYFGPGGLDPNYSATERDNLGESLLPDGSTALDGWATRSLRYAAYVTPDPVALWASYAPLLDIVPVIIEPLAPELEVNDVGYVAGTLTGARMTIAPGGRFYVDIRLRAELLPGTDTP